MNEHWELHECDHLPQNGVQILYAMDYAERNAKTWRLIIRREATYDDLMENHMLEAERDTLWETSLEITHCPYCGKKLYDAKVSTFENYGQFWHRDCTEWKSKRQRMAIECRPPTGKKKYGEPGPGLIFQHRLGSWT